jgi:hypothetical protein
MANNDTPEQNGEGLGGALSKFDKQTLGAMQPTQQTGAMFVPQTMNEAMEMAKLMAAGRFVPPHLRGKPGDCLAVVMQASRWAMDPFAVAGKTYFVNDRMAYEAQLVNAVVNTRAPLQGRLHVEWTGEGNDLVCTVTGYLKGDSRPKQVSQRLGDLQTRNSPLWKQSPRQQLAYYSTRMWARLYTPEVLMGVYTPDEMESAGDLEEQPDGTYAPAQPAAAGRNKLDAFASDGAGQSGYTAADGSTPPADKPLRDHYRDQAAAAGVGDDPDTAEAVNTAEGDMFAGQPQGQRRQPQPKQQTKAAGKQQKAAQDPGAPYTLTTLDLNQHQYDRHAAYEHDLVAALKAAPDSDQAADLWQANQEEVQRLQQHAPNKAHAIWQAYQATQPAEEGAG